MKLYCISGFTSMISSSLMNLLYQASNSFGVILHHNSWT